jgi:hypothetical protein
MRNLRRLLACVTAALVLGCTDSVVSTGPEAETTSLSLGGRNSDPQRHRELQQLLKAEKERINLQKELRKEGFETAHRAWKIARSQRKNSKDPGSNLIELLRCEPRPYEGEAAIIGPDGGTLQVGEHQLVIPRGALVREELVVAEAPTNTLVELEFSPDGLIFDSPASVMLSYRRCQVPARADLLMAYLGQGNRVLELPPSWDDKADSRVIGEIGHFSRYAVAY